MKDLQLELRRAKKGYEAAMTAMAYMPIESRPYTQKTAEKYLYEIGEIKKQIAEARK